MPFTDHMPGPHVPNRRWTKPKMVTVAEASVELWLISLGPPPGPRSDVKGRNRSHARPDSVSQISGTRNLERRNCCVSRGFGVPGFGTPLGWPGRRFFFKQVRSKEKFMGRAAGCYGVHWGRLEFGRRPGGGVGVGVVMPRLTGGDATAHLG